MIEEEKSPNNNGNIGEDNDDDVDLRPAMRNGRNGSDERQPEQ